MPDQFGIVEVPLLGGLDQKTDPRKVQPGKLLTATNIQRLKDGSFAKRYGTTALTMTDFTAGAVALSSTLTRLGTRGDELLLMHRTGGAGYLYTYAKQAARWRVVDRLNEFTARNRPIAAGAPGAYAGDVAYDSSTKTLGFIWLEPTSSTGAAGNIVSIFVDASTGAVIAGPLVVATAGYSPRILHVGSSVFVAVWAQSGNTISASTVSAASRPMTWASATNLHTDAAEPVTLAAFDVATVGSGFFYLVYEVTGGLGPITVEKYTSGLVLSQSGTSTSGHVGITHFGIDVSSNSSSTGVVIAYHRYTGGNQLVHAQWYNASNCSETTSAIAISSVALSTSSTCYGVGVKQTSAGAQAQVAWSALENAATVGTTRYAVRTGVFDTTAVTGTNRLLNHAVLLSRPFVESGSTYAVVMTGGFAGSGSGFDWCTQLVDLAYTDTSTASLVPRPVCTINTRLVAQPTPLTTISSVVQDGNSRWRVTTPTAFVQGARSQLTDTELDPVVSTRSSVELGGLMYISGGVPSYYDGTRVSEIGFMHGPATVAASSATAGSMDAGGTYRYGIIYSQVDALGQVHRSDPYYLTITLAGGEQTCVLTISMLSCTTRQDPGNSTNKPFVEIYRSEGGASATLYRLTGEIPYASGVTASSSGTMQNSTTTDGITYTDSTSDATLTGAVYGIYAKPFIYTQGNGATPGQLDNVCPPSARLICVHRNRLWLAGCPDGKQLWPSKKQVAGEPVGFSDGLVFYVDGGDEITALASMDDKLLVFKEDRIFYITGDGPADSGLQNDWSEPVPVNCTVGCTNPDSVVATPVGVMFQGSSGLCLIDRGLNVNALFGAAVADEFTGYTITSAVIIPDRTEVRFGMIDPTNGYGKELRYDYRLNEWTLATYGSSASPTTMRHAIVSGGVYHFVSSTPTVYKEDTTLHTDAGSFVSYTVEMMLSVAGTLGYQDAREVVLLMDGKTQGYVTVSADYDGLGAYTETKTWSNAGAVANGDPVTDGGTHVGEYVLSLSLRRAAKSRRVKVKITDSYSGATHTLSSGRGSDIVGLAIKVAQKEGPFKNVASNNKG